MSARSFVLGQWWESFRLVLLLAIGPAILAVALGTAYKQVRMVIKTTTLPSGAQTQTWEPPDPTDANSEMIGELRLGPRMLAAGSLIVTILVHGAAAVGIGLALSIGIKRSKRALVGRHRPRRVARRHPTDLPVHSDESIDFEWDRDVEFRDGG